MTGFNQTEAIVEQIVEHRLKTLVKDRPSMNWLLQYFILIRFQRCSTVFVGGGGGSMRSLGMGAA